MKKEARVVVIGGGIVGCSILYHLAKAGWKDVVMVEKSELTSGSTCMAAGMLTQFNSSPTLMRMRKYSSELYDALGVYGKVGSLRMAASKEQHLTLQRAVSTAKGVGLDVEMITPEDAIKLMPWASPDDLYSAVYLPNDGHIDPHGTTYAVAKAAKELGAEIYLNTLVTGIDLTADGRVAAVRTSKGKIKTEIIINSAGMWGKQVAAMVGAKVPSTPVVHQHLALQAVPGSELPDGGPCFRDTDRLIYGRPEHGGLLFGGWELNPPSIWEDGVAWSHSSTEVASDFDRFEHLLVNAIKRFPFLEEAGIERLVAHPDAFTPDARPLVGPWPTVKGFWMACGLSMEGFGAAGGIGKALAEWIIEGQSEVDLFSFHPWRFGKNFHDPYYAASCGRECYRYYYYTRYPQDEDTEMRPRRITPFHYRLQDLGAVFGKKNGWERVNYLNPGQPWRRAGEDQRAAGGWVKPPWFDLTGAECRAFRERVGMVDLSGFGKIDLKGVGALPLLNRLAVSEMDKPAGSVIYTQFCNERGGILADITIVRIAEHHFRLVTGTGFIDNDLGHIKSWLQQGDPEVEIRDVTEDYAVIALWGPKAGSVLQKVTEDDVSTEAVPCMAAKSIKINGVDVLIQRLSYAGEYGWELYVLSDQAVIVWDSLWESGQEYEIAACGYYSLNSLRMEKGYLYHSDDVTGLENPYEAGIGFTVDRKKDFIGSAALAKVCAEGVLSKLCTLVVGTDEWLPLYGGEAVLSDGKVISRLRGVAYGYTVNKNIGNVYLPPEMALPGKKVQVEIFGDMVDAVVAERVLYDPGGEKLR
ncbi:MAG: GcvT family protein [Deltaproteobacteria bacterium]|nr:GcvT family protein [Deltaproteobacteria bacterium]MBW2659538.1 GcvT family protein [Deltaproteobacteria bacterium]